MASSMSSDIPRLPANARMKAFRLEAGISWVQFNRMWIMVHEFINSPSNEILIDSTRASETEYRRKVVEVTHDVVATGTFGPGSCGRWHCNPGRDGHRICEYIASIIAYAAGELVRQTPAHRAIEGDNVGNWLPNQQATNWEHDDPIAHPGVPASRFAPEGILSCEASFCSRSTVADDDTVMEEGSVRSGGSTAAAETVLAVGHKVLRVGRAQQPGR